MKILKFALAFLLINILFLGFTFASLSISIQDTINAASPGDKIVIKRGEYIEKVVINKSIRLEGEDLNSVIFNSNESGDVITIFSENVLLKSVSVKNSGEGFAGVYIKAKNVTIINCAIMNCHTGIKIDASSKIRIINCTILNNAYAGIRVWGQCEDIEIQNSTIFGSKYAIGLFTFSKKVKLFANVIYRNHIGVALINSKENQIIKNSIFNNSYGLYFEDRLSTDNIVSKNNLSKNTCGVYVNIFSEGSTNNLFYRNNFINNTVQVRFESPFFSVNHWNSSYLLGGNYWSDHMFEDADSNGFVDEPYIIAENNVDYFPLASPYKEPIAETKADGWLLSQIMVAVVIVFAVYGLTYLLFRRRWSEKKIGEESEPSAFLRIFLLGRYMQLLLLILLFVQPTKSIECNLAGSRIEG